MKDQERESHFEKKEPQLERRATLRIHRVPPLLAGPNKPRGLDGHLWDISAASIKRPDGLH